MDQVSGEVKHLNLSSLLCVLSEVNNHWEDVIQGCLEVIVAKFSLTQAQGTAFFSASRALAVADRTVTDLAFITLRIAEITALLLARRAVPLAAVSHVRVLAASKPKVIHT